MALTLIQKARIDKVELEEELLELLRNFEKKTGFEVDYINMDREESMGKLERTLVSLSVNLSFR